ncbi:DUF3000 domain-containing protein [Paractinoplanes brasiliensis]|uniref:DUF3000 family protein n=1 Tax=Paractinoplanes brasiliensis TaxID=52695 RepID=A0A4R6K1A8_9ACTN|nr:DUF3000 domain-containing protein [Actinoplanes brasiliensis]TDO40885.1 hypothetical protein C8E87_4605 [Actinoplanes brasiliensis]GID25953.1 membrane protein [Actinoplanes brasiliensis]
MASPSAVPPAFARAVDALRAPAPRPEILLEEIAAPQRLAPYSFAISATVLRSGDEVAGGRLILLHDPAGHEAWHGDIRLVTLVTAELEDDLAGDPMLSAVAWTWLTDALDQHSAAYTAIGGTITQTTSTRFGELAGPAPTADLEVRASWTPTGDDFAAHLQGWCAMLASTAGLPPPGVTALGASARSFS